MERAELYLIAPATANTLAKLAHGQADNLLTAAALAAACPIAVAPAMNNRMYLNPATRANLDLLQARGVTVIPPTEGALASHGEQGIGRLAEPAELLEACEALLAPAGGDYGDPPDLGSSLQGARVLVTAGGTREPIDSVRFIGNRSSGRMGFALAREAARRGADVTLIAANVGTRSSARGTDHSGANRGRASRLLPNRIARLRRSADERRRRRLPSGWARQPQAEEGSRNSKLELEPTEDVLAALAELRRADQVIVGFAAEHGEDAVELGRGKLERKRLDAIVINDISRAEIGFEVDENEVTILTADGVQRHVPRARKEQVARAVLDEVERLRAAREGTDGARADTRSPARV